VLIPERLWSPIQHGDVTMAFRRWKRLQVKPGRAYRSAAGRLRFLSVTEIGEHQIFASSRTSGSP